MTRSLAATGVVVPGYQLHFLSDDHLLGGHARSLLVRSALLEVSVCDELHVELPSGVAFGVAGSVDQSTITAVEGGESREGAAAIRQLQAGIYERHDIALRDH